MKKTVLIIATVLLYCSCGTVGVKQLGNEIMGDQNNLNSAISLNLDILGPLIDKEKSSKIITFLEKYDYEGTLEDIIKKNNLKNEYVGNYKRMWSSRLNEEFKAKLAENQEINSREIKKDGLGAFLSRSEVYYKIAPEERVETIRQIILSRGVGNPALAITYSNILLLMLKEDILIAPKNLSSQLGDKLFESNIRYTLYSTRLLEFGDLKKILWLMKNDDGKHIAFYKSVEKIRLLFTKKLQRDLENYLN